MAILALHHLGFLLAQSKHVYTISGLAQKITKNGQMSIPNRQQTKTAFLACEELCQIVPFSFSDLPSTYLVFW
jgi:hypothetical protein